ncbi:hypothetical protein [Agromyces italicus]|uniref:hypothetical protein n=1 Tax=Agromyces italicus TaxID=279572 RepID=UPI0003B3564F|nr:hypothetical protein [Agromyces italicus]
MIAVAAAVVVAAAYATVLVAPAPRADATLRQTGAHPDDQLLLRMESEGGETGFRPKPGYGGHDQEIELSTLSAFGAFRGFELWSAVNAFESPCLIAYHRATDDIVARSCVPSGADLFVDTQSHGLGPGQRLRFQLRGDTVDAFVLRPAGAE